MELALSLGESTKQPFSFLDKASKMASSSSNKDLGFCMGLGVGFGGGRSSSPLEVEKTEETDSGRGERLRVSSSSSDPPLQLDLLPFSPVPRGHASNQLRFPWLAENSGCEAAGLSDTPGGIRLDVNRLPTAVAVAAAAAEEAERLSSSPPNSDTSSFQLDFGIRSSGSGKGKRGGDEMGEGERSGSRASDDDENGSTRKKLRLSKEQSAFLEESFKEHNTLNPKQKLELAKQLNLRPRQVEVWFQNRRARTKLKQTEVDCEYLKRCCETLTEENRRLQKELQELRALKTSRPFYMQLPATTLTMCPSCERVATTTTSAATATATTTAAAAATTSATVPLLASSNNNNNNARPSSYPFSPVKAHARQAQGQDHVPIQDHHN